MKKPPRREVAVSMAVTFVMMIRYRLWNMVRWVICIRKMIVLFQIVFHLFSSVLSEYYRISQ